MKISFNTTLGSFDIELSTRCPQNVRHFVKLCRLHFYTGQLFYRLEPDTLCQTGDPTGTGLGGKSLSKIIGEDKLQKELDFSPFGKFKHRGLVAVAGLDSEIFITLTDRHLDYLDHKHTIIGSVITSHFLDNLNETLVDEKNRPLQDIVITDVQVDDPFPDSPELIKLYDQFKEMYTPNIPLLKKLYRLSKAEIEQSKHLDEKSKLELQRQRESRNRALTLQMMGDLPSADVKPEDNVLFVCHLNPITQDDDLSLIFSRFGPLLGCEIVRGPSGESLQYAFIEFENHKSCEEAYFKMENVLIDDRRIHVDFSQSVAKLRTVQRSSNRKIESTHKYRNRSRERSPRR